MVTGSVKLTNDLQTTKLVSSLKGLHNISFRCMEQEGPRVWIGCDGMIYVYDALTYELLSCVTVPLAANRIHVAPDNAVWIGGRTGTVAIWAWKDGRPQLVMQTTPHGGRVTCIVGSGKYMWTSSFDSRIIIWDAEKRRALQELAACDESYAVNWLAVSRRGVVSLSKDAQVVEWRYIQRKNFQLPTFRSEAAHGQSVDGAPPE
eukprot:TRINITY_DN5045_c0_g1_i1.p1 TRINITY_DN5045_c0_g1~~TRINITY_DN5045_c0_g1_i1.p1  ORF type:complete len:204 (-),score=36.55 TRINITY_DN5045_c0_g1_i1:56-667(-)